MKAPAASTGVGQPLTHQGHKGTLDPKGTVKNYALYGGIAGFSVPADAVKAAKEQGLFVLKRVGQVVKTDAKEMRAFT